VIEHCQLGRSTAKVIALINALVEKNVRVVILKQNMDIHLHELFSLLGELEHDLVSVRTKDGISCKKSSRSNIG